MTTDKLVFLIREYRIWLILIFLMIISAIVSSGSFIHTSNLINILFLATPIGIAAIGEILVILTAGIDLSIASVWILAGVVGSSMANAGFNPLLALLASLVVGVLCGAVNGIIIAKFELSPLITTLGTLSIFEAIARIFTANMPVMSMPKGYQLIGNLKLGSIPFQTIVWILLIIATVIFIKRTISGRTVFALGGNPEASRYSGLPVGRSIFLIYCISGLLAGLAGTLNSAYMNIAAPNADLNNLFIVIAGCVVGGASLFGGKGNLVNTAAGVLVIIVIQNLLHILGVSPFIFQGIIGIVIVAAVLLNVSFNKDNVNERHRTKGV